MGRGFSTVAGLVGKADAVRKNRDREGLDIFGTGVRTALKEGAGLASTEERERGAWTCTECEFGVLSCRFDDGMEIKGHVAFHADISDLLLEFAQGFKGHHGLGVIERVGGLAIKEDLDLVFFAWITKADADEKAVKLGFGEGISALVIDRVLGGDHKERRRQRMGCAVDGNLSLVHGFKQRRLGAWRSAVDLVGKQKMMKDRALVKMKSAVFGIEDRRAKDIGGQKIRSELNAGKVEVEGLCECFGERCFSDAGDIFEQDMPCAEDADHGKLDPFALCENNATDGGEDIFECCLGMYHRCCCVGMLGHVRSAPCCGDRIDRLRWRLALFAG